MAAAPSECPYPRDSAGSVYDFTTAIVIGLACIPFLAANGVILYYRTYPPIRAKSVDLTILSSVGGFIWIASSLIANGHFERQINTLWSICSFWTFWMQLCFGFALWLNCLNARLYNLYRIFILREKAIKWIVIPLFVLLTPVMIFCAFASKYRASRFDENDEDCRIISTGWAVAAICFLPFYFCLFLGFGIRLRSIMSQYNEFRIIMLGGAFSGVLFLLSLVILQTHAYLQIAGRCANTVAVTMAVFFYFWARMGEPVYNTIFHKEEYEKKFFYQLQHSANPPKNDYEKRRESTGPVHNQSDVDLEDPQIDAPDDSTIMQKIDLILSNKLDGASLNKEFEALKEAHKTLVKENEELKARLNSKTE